jgi:hypothetical protein
MNNQNNHNEEEDIRGLIDQIRQQGTPYSEEPDPLYWANFRVRVMDRVAEPERIGIFAKAKAWLWESGLRTSLAGGGLAVLLLGGIYFGTQQDQNGQSTGGSQNGQVAQQQTTDGDPTVNPIDSSVPNTPIAPDAITPDAQQPELAQDQPVTPDVTPSTEQPKTVDQLTDAEVAAPVLAANSDLSGPATSLDDMTEQELTALLSSIEEMN